MADEVRQYTITVPAGILPAAPLTFPMAMPPRQVEALQIVVPPGPSGFVGFAVLVGGGRVIPYQSDAWIVTAGENITWPLEHMPNSGAWSVLAYNTGAQDHSIYFRWLLKYLGTWTTAPGLDTLPESDINALSPQSIPLV